MRFLSRDESGTKKKGWGSTAIVQLEEEVSVESVPDEKPLMGTLACSRSGCEEHTGTACQYVDRRGRRCETAWCPLHQMPIFDRAYCTRHGNLFVAILEGKLLAAPLPDLGNRAPSLIVTVTSGIDDAVVSFLEKLCGEGEKVTRRATALSTLPENGERVWSWRWAISSHVGISFAITILIHENSPDRLEAFVDGEKIDIPQPPWLGGRAGDENMREIYNYEVVNIISQAATSRFEQNQKDAFRTAGYYN